MKFSLEIRIFCKCRLALGHHNAALKLKRIPGLSYFTPHDPTIHDPTMHDSTINYNSFWLLLDNWIIIQTSLHYAEKTLNTMQLELYSA